ncbi:MAG: hypothetical protein M5U28_36120 [Sandaracinaceae bacterium]|nr:hypothetical protein [Sandaracinaceae bacterium]
MSAARKLRRAQAKAATSAPAPGELDIATLATSNRALFGVLVANRVLSATLACVNSGRGADPRAVSCAVATTTQEIELLFGRGEICGGGSTVRGACQVVHTIRSLPRRASTPTLAPERLARGATVIVCGGGPSLARELERVARLADRAIVIATNTSARVVCGALRPDVIVAAEHLDISSALEGTRAGLYALSPASAPATWSVPIDPIAVLPRETGGAICSAIQIALGWGAARVVLVGVDLAGEHAPGTPMAPASRSAWEVEAWRRSAESAGVPYEPPPTWTPAIAPGVDGRAVATWAHWTDQRDRFEAIAARTSADLVNASGGVQINGCRNAPLASLEVDGPKPDLSAAATGEPMHIASEVASLRTAIDNVRDAVCAREELRALGVVRMGEDVGRLCSLVARLAAPVAPLDQLVGTGPFADASAWIAAWSAAADRAEALLSEAGY